MCVLDSMLSTNNAKSPSSSETSLAVAGAPQRILLTVILFLWAPCSRVPLLASTSPLGYLKGVQTYRKLTFWYFLSLSFSLMFPLVPPPIQVCMQVKNLYFRLTISSSPDLPSLWLCLNKHQYLFYLLNISGVCPNLAMSSTTGLAPVSWAPL